MNGTTKTTGPEFTVTGEWPAPDYADAAQRKSRDAELSKLIFDPTLTELEAQMIMSIIPERDLDNEESAHLRTVAAGGNLARDLTRNDSRPEPELTGF
jgi:hypothetical protein